MLAQMRLRLTGLAHGGDALGRLGGKTLFVPFGAPGDEVLVELVEDRGTWGRARLLEVLKPAPERVKPPCPYFGRCGGCQLQHLRYSAQLAGKRAVVGDQLMRLGGRPDVDVQPVLGMADPWQYRNRAELYPTRTGTLGIRAGADPHPLPIGRCLLFHPLITTLFQDLELELDGLERLTLRAGVTTGQQMILFEMEDDQAPNLEVDVPLSCVMGKHDGDLHVLIGNSWIEELVAGRRLRLTARTAFPANTAMAEVLLEQVRRWLAPRPGDLLLDAGGGAGLFGLGLSDTLGGIVVLEDDPWAADDYLTNAGEGVNVGVFTSVLPEGLAEIDSTVDLAVLSPRRVGLGVEGAEQLARLGPRRLAYVAADPAVLARDVRPLSEAGYRLRLVQPVDVLPQTAQIHVLAGWERIR